MEKLSYEYIRGLVEGEGCFTFSTIPKRLPDGKIKRVRIPAFSIAMHKRDEDLLRMVRVTLDLQNSIYRNTHTGKDGTTRHKVILIVRDFGQLKNIIIPLFYKKLKGNKGKQFMEWLEKIGNDPTVSESYRLLYRLHKCGFYDKNPKFND